MEVLHESAKEIGGGVFRDLAVIGDQPRRELDVGFRGIHLGRVAETEHAAQILLGDCCAYCPGDVPITADGLRVNELVP